MQPKSDRDLSVPNMRQVLLYAVVGLISCFSQWTLLVSTAQRKPAAVDTTKSGEADGQRSPALTGERRPLYRLQRSDVVEMSFTFSPEFNQIATVRPDGYISLKGVPELYAEGMNVPELKAVLVRAYSSVLHEPEITLTLKDFERPYFVATGEVARPGKYELRGDTTVTEALAMSGGLTGQAKHSNVVLFRKISADTTEAKLLNVKRMMKARDLRENTYLKTGDLLFVPQNNISKIKRFLPTSALSMYWNGAR